MVLSRSVDLSEDLGNEPFELLLRIDLFAGFLVVWTSVGSSCSSWQAVVLDRSDVEAASDGVVGGGTGLGLLSFGVAGRPLTVVCDPLAPLDSEPFARSGDSSAVLRLRSKSRTISFTFPLTTQRLSLGDWSGSSGILSLSSQVADLVCRSLVTGVRLVVSVIVSPPPSGSGRSSKAVDFGLHDDAASAVVFAPG